MNDHTPLSALQNVSLSDALLSRRSIRRFSNEPIDPECIRIALEAACLAPSPHGTAPWRFCLLSSGESKKRLAEEMGKDFLKDMKAEGVPEEEQSRRYNGSIRLLTNAPVLILAALSYGDLDKYEDPQKQDNERMMAEHSLGAALQNLMIALASQGIGSVWRCAPLFCRETARSALDLPLDWVPRALIVAGIPAFPSPSKEIPTPEFVIR